MRKTKVKNLPSWSKIQFRAIAQNIFGSGEPSEETQFDHCETPPARKLMKLKSNSYQRYYINR